MHYKLHNLNNEVNQYRCTVAPVPEGQKRPLWSVMIPTYNCAHYLEDTLQSVLIQDLGEDIMEICVVDDHSTKDNPEKVVKAIGKGRVKFFRQPKNVGHTQNFATCLNLSRGYLVHQLHGDDMVKYGFYSKMQTLFETNPKMGAAFCRHYFIDENSEQLWCSTLEQAERGVLQDWLRRMGENQIAQTPSMVVRRSVYEHLGGFDSRLKYCEDWEMWVRIAANYPVGYEPEPLAKYRIHNSSNTSRNTATAQNIRDLELGISIMYHYLEQETRDETRAKASRFWAWWALQTAGVMVSKHKDKKGARAQLHAGLRLCKSLKYMWAVAKFYRRVL
jgi:glycosyltransferase involved in cell wall biosynthesis